MTIAVLGGMRQDGLVVDGVEQALTGGAQTAGLVRVGATVRRPAHPRSDRTQELLRHLEAAGFDGAPRALGYDEQGRELLSFVEGEVAVGPPFRLSDDCLLSATRLVKAFHDAASSSPLSEDQETVCHGDLGPHNTIFREGIAVAIIDWDEDIAAGARAVDFAHAVWCFADLTEPDVSLEQQARNTRLMCSAYTGMTPDVVVTELAARFRRARTQHATAGRTGGVAVFDRLIGWIERHGAEISG